MYAFIIGFLVIKFCHSYKLLASTLYTDKVRGGTFDQALDVTQILLHKCTYYYVIVFVFFDIHYLHNIMLLYYVGSVHKVKRSHKKKLATAAPPISSMLQCVMIYYYII